jgi:hypothetical protein
MAVFLAQTIRSRWACVFCLAVVVLAAVLPPNGPPLPLCQFKNLTHLPCLTCGLTRSFIGMAHFNPARAALFHPLGLVLFPLVAMIAALLVAPDAVRERVAQSVEQRRRLWGGFGIGLVAFLVVYGFGRMAWLLVTHHPSPW